MIINLKRKRNKIREVEFIYKRLFLSVVARYYLGFAISEANYF
jgi:hypothetical protein